MAGKQGAIPPPRPPHRQGLLVFRHPALANTCHTAPAPLATVVSVVPADCLHAAFANMPASLATASCLGETKVRAAATPQLPITPLSKLKRLMIFIKLAKKGESRKDRRRCGEGGNHITHKTHFKERVDGGLPQDHRSRMAHTEESPPGKSSYWDHHDRPTPSYGSYKLTGIRNHPRSQHNMLPVWLEERPGAFPQSSTSITAAEEVSVINDNSFETRWDSLRGKNKVYSSPWIRRRPPGWEDVGNTNVVTHTRNFRNNYSPVSSIQNISSSTTENTQTASMPPYDLIASQPTNQVSENQHNFYEDGSEKIQSSRNTNQHFSDSFLGVQKHSAPISGSNSSDNTLDDDEFSNMPDHHLWASSDSFYCENFTFCDNKPKEVHKSDITEQPRSYSQLYLRKNNSENSDEYSQTSNIGYNEEHTSYDDKAEGMNSKADSFRHTWEEQQVPDTPPLDRLSLSESFCDFPNLPHTTCRGRESMPYCDHNMPSDATLATAETTHWRNWVQFDCRSMELSNLDTHFAQGVSQDIIIPDKRQHIQAARDQLPSDKFKKLPSTNDNHQKSILNLKESTIANSSVYYRGRLMRTYSQRGRRASKQMINSLSHRMTSQDYGKVPEPKAPIFSKAVLTMHGGLGLFEQANTADDPNSEDTGPMSTEKTSQKEQQNEKENPVPPPTTTASRSFLESAKVVRVGSLRMPHLPAAIVHRSASLNTPKVKPGEIPFQRLHERRQGSFRKTMSGLGALARSFRQKSNTGQKERAAKATDDSERSVAGASQGIQCSGCFSVSASKPTPRAPRLPRRATGYRLVSQESHQLDHQRASSMTKGAR